MSRFVFINTAQARVSETVLNASILAECIREGEYAFVGRYMGKAAMSGVINSFGVGLAADVIIDTAKFTYRRINNVPMQRVDPNHFHTVAFRYVKKSVVSTAGVYYIMYSTPVAAASVGTYCVYATLVGYPSWLATRVFTDGAESKAKAASVFDKVMKPMEKVNSAVWKATWPTGFKILRHGWSTKVITPEVLREDKPEWTQPVPSPAAEATVPSETVPPEGSKGGDSEKVAEGSGEKGGATRVRTSRFRFVRPARVKDQAAGEDKVSGSVEDSVVGDTAVEITFSLDADTIKANPRDAGVALREAISKQNPEALADFRENVLLPDLKTFEITQRQRTQFLAGFDAVPAAAKA